MISQRKRRNSRGHAEVTVRSAGHEDEHPGHVDGHTAEVAAQGDVEVCIRGQGHEVTKNQDEHEAISTEQGKKPPYASGSISQVGRVERGELAYRGKKLDNPRAILG